MRKGYVDSQECPPSPVLPALDGGADGAGSGRWRGADVGNRVRCPKGNLALARNDRLAQGLPFAAASGAAEAALVTVWAFGCIVFEATPAQAGKKPSSRKGRITSNSARATNWSGGHPREPKGRWDSSSGLPFGFLPSTEDEASRAAENPIPSSWYRARLARVELWS